MPLIQGTAGADTLRGASDSDTIVGGAGDDVILSAGLGANSIIAGDGDDRIEWGGASSFPRFSVDGGAGTDTLDFSSFNGASYFFSRGISFRDGPLPNSIEAWVDGYERILDQSMRTLPKIFMDAVGIERILGGYATSVELDGFTTDLEVHGQGAGTIITGSGNDVVALHGWRNSFSGSTLKGNFTVDAGSGRDTLRLDGAGGDYLIVQTGSGFTVYDGPTAVHTVKNVEHIQFGDGPVTTLAAAGTLDFDAAGYLARYADLRAAFGTDEVKAYQHWKIAGEAEGRIGSFDALSYIASYRDLINAYGPNASAGAYHYMVAGMNEGRIVSFDPAAYAASNIDLARIIGTDATRAASHYITNGVNEGRATAGFDSVAYLLSNPDLAGMTPAQARTHWLTSGADDGRVGDALFGREQTAFNFTGSSVASQFETATDKDWFAIALPVYQYITFNGSAGVTGLAVYNATGRLIASDADGRDFRFFISNSDGAYGPAPYYLVATGGSVSSYTVTVTTQPMNAAAESQAVLMAAGAGTKAPTDDYVLADPGATLADTAVGGPAGPEWHDVTSLLA